MPHIQLAIVDRLGGVELFFLNVAKDIGFSVDHRTLFWIKPSHGKVSVRHGDISQLDWQVGRIVYRH